ncbi:MAG: hypothetical protein JO129_01665 [Candidatus Dependentiae bacterium]|nr:hypothetical protein [Candidatus Dependentiae bacterium]
MSKSSKKCGYTGHMHILNRGMNENKEVFDSTQNKKHMKTELTEQNKHVKKGSGIVYPEAQCNCKK